jgi:putative transposase
MPRTLRVDHAGEIYHVMNRTVGKVQLFFTPDNYLVFIKLLQEAAASYKVDILAYSIMPNHWHLLLRPNEDGEMGRFMHWLSTTHTCKVRTTTDTIGHGPIYKGRYKSFLVDSQNYLLRVIAYIERNAVRASLVKSPVEWRWCSAWMRSRGDNKQKIFLKEIPLELNSHYNEIIENEESSEDLAK